MMMMHKQDGGTSYRIDRVFKGVGRIAIASGTSHAGTFGRISAMLTGLHKTGRLDLLAAIRDLVHAPLVVLNYYERGQLEKLPSAATAAPLIAALWAFQERHECGASYRADVGTSIRHVEAEARAASIVADIPALLRTLKPKMKDRPVAFNRLRTHMMAFASDIQGKHSPLWVEIVRVNRFKKAEGTRARKLLRRPLTVAELDAVCEVFTDVVVHGGRRGTANQGKLVVRRTIMSDDLARMARTLAFTGMRPAEYWQRNGATWEFRHGYVDVDGTKTPAAVRPTFKIGILTIPKCGEQFFRREFTKATEKALRVGLDTYSLRRTFAKLCEDAGVVMSRREAYLGHGPKTITDIYLQTMVLPFVAQDAELVGAWVESERDRAAKKTIENPIALVRGS